MMSDQYRRTRGLFKPNAKKPFALSRFRLENFIRCHRCFYLDRRLGIEPPSMPSFTLNIAVDELLKKEFDSYRAKREPHPLMIQNQIEAIPYAHQNLDEWRQPFRGIRFHHKPSDFIVFGAVDDLWINRNDEIIVVDYKATSTMTPITLEGQYKEGYKRQMEIYQWLLRQLGFKICDTGYFVYCNGDKSKPDFGGRLEFLIDVIPYKGNDRWVPGALLKARECLELPQIPDFNETCLFCQYHQVLNQAQGTPIINQPLQGDLF